MIRIAATVNRSIRVWGKFLSVYSSYEFVLRISPTLWAERDIEWPLSSQISEDRLKTTFKSFNINTEIITKSLSRHCWLMKTGGFSCSRIMPHPDAINFCLEDAGHFLFVSAEFKFASGTIEVSGFQHSLADSMRVASLLLTIQVSSVVLFGCLLR